MHEIFKEALKPFAPKPDRMIYFVLCRYSSGLAWQERLPHNMSRKETLIDIRSGELPDVQQILECNPAEHICSDVTGERDFADAIHFAFDRQQMQAAE